ncbi:RNA polymerase sigma subunit ECF family protein [Jannaschia pagri]|uniref:RNA polymerase sigma subunit ECF family protein n=1 Tax=Jannaschia pagri TaxID=2829797 RepID=A0ABQ4NJC4_9RHOB|nr:MULTISPECIES: sigma-70 family RNA polymerase sigma factor [unclassified Jannaschia]GIT90678.1 RNA polymerase sigma subunit ECF family protein [Jannaschia sp. AI_61]GIT94510.1 RNA polymerase sigma subunit ECF family protein [Jannaschia sp. AI_62]
MTGDTPQDEGALLSRAAAGDAAAAATLVDRLGPRLLAFCLRLTGGDRAEAEDIVQETFLRLWRKADEWDANGTARLSTWMGRVASNLAIDRKRRAKRAAPMDDATEVPDGTPGIEARLIEGDRRAALVRALDSLPPRQRQAVVLRHIEGYSNPDIAAMMGTGVEAVESLIARGKRQLTATLTEGQDI